MAKTTGSFPNLDHAYAHIVNKSLLMIYNMSTLSLVVRVNWKNSLGPMSNNAKIIGTKTGRVFTLGERSFMTECSEFEREKLRFVKLGAIMSARKFFSFLELKNGFLLCIGGQTDLNKFNDMPLKECFVIDITSKNFIKIASLTKARCRHASTVFDEKTVYTYGGTVLQGYLYGFSFVERIELSYGFKGSWTPIDLKPIPTTVMSLTSCLILNATNEDVLLLESGLVNGEYHARTIAFNRNTNRFNVKDEHVRKIFWDFVEPVYQKENGHCYLFTGNGDLCIYNGKKWISIEGFAEFC